MLVFLISVAVLIIGIVLALTIKKSPGDDIGIVLIAIGGVCVLMFGLVALQYSIKSKRENKLYQVQRERFVIQSAIDYETESGILSEDTYNAIKNWNDNLEADKKAQNDLWIGWYQEYDAEFVEPIVIPEIYIEPKKI